MGGKQWGVWEAKWRRDMKETEEGTEERKEGSEAWEGKRGAIERGKQTRGRMKGWE